jgi:hypothetical protein
MRTTQHGFNLKRFYERSTKVIPFLIGSGTIVDAEIKFTKNPKTINNIFTPNTAQ